MPKDDKQNLRGALMALLSMGIFATHDVVVKTLGAYYTPFQIVFFASVLSFPLVTGFILQEKGGGSLRPDLRALALPPPGGPR